MRYLPYSGICMSCGSVCEDGNLQPTVTEYTCNISSLNNYKAFLEFNGLCGHDCTHRRSSYLLYIYLYIWL